MILFKFIILFKNIILLYSVFRLSFFQLHHSTIDLLRIEFHNLFLFTFFSAIMVLWLGSQIQKVNSDWLESIYYIVVLVYILKKVLFLNFFLVELYFYQSYVLYLDLSSWSGHISLIFLFYLCLKFEWYNFKLIYFWIELKLNLLN